MSDTVTIHHPKTDATATVRKRAVAGWVRAGWQPVQDGDADASATVEPSHFLVLAGTKNDALAWAKDHEVTQASVTYASAPEAVAGVEIDGLAVVELDSFAGHRKEGEIRDAIAAAFADTTPEPDTAGTEDAAAAGTSTAHTTQE